MIPSKYRYYCPTRPPTPGVLPVGRTLVNIGAFGTRRYVAEIDRMVWGWVEYTEPLTPAEVSEYELVSAPLEVE